MSNFRIDDVMKPYEWQEPQVGRLSSRESNLRPLTVRERFWRWLDAYVDRRLRTS